MTSSILGVDNTGMTSFSIYFIPFPLYGLDNAQAWAYTERSAGFFFIPSRPPNAVIYLDNAQAWAYTEYYALIFLPSFPKYPHLRLSLWTYADITHLGHLLPPNNLYSATIVVAEEYSFADHLRLSISREATWPGDDLLHVSHLDAEAELDSSNEHSPNPSGIDVLGHELSEELFGLGELTPLNSPQPSRCSSPNLILVPPTISLGEPSSPITAVHPHHARDLQPAPLPLRNELQHKNSSQRRKERSKLQSKVRKRRKREEIMAQEFSIPARPKPTQKYVENSSPISADFDFLKCKHTRGSYTGMKTGFESSETHSLEELVGPNSRGFHLVKWDGRTPMPITDQDHRVIGVLAGRPSNWDDVAAEAARLMQEAQQSCRVSSSTAQEVGRGKFVSLRCGVSHGGGQTHPQKMANNSKNERLLRKLNAAEPFRRITGFASAVFATWAPGLHAYYEQTAQDLYAKYPDLPRPFERSVFCATTYNLGPAVVCHPHIDLANLSFGWCTIMALGSFDHTKGGHLVLWTCKLVIEFPPGSLVLIPSAVIPHSNTVINTDAGETRFSVTQYTAGGLFRWVENGYTALEAYKATLGKEGVKEWRKWMDDRWTFGMAFIPLHYGATSAIPCSPP